MTRSVAVIGGGPAGLMAAETLGRAGIAVIVYEHMPSVGRKLLLAGRAGLNITHSEPVDKLLTRYGVAKAILEPAIRAFTPHDLRVWCATLGEPTFVGSTARVFPASFRATPLLRAWLARLAELGVTIEPRHRWLGWVASADGRPNPLVSTFSSPDGGTVEVTSDATVFALGGASWPRVGSDGCWVDVFRNAGVAVNDLRAANGGVRIPWTKHFADRFAGVPLKNVAVSVGGSSIRGDAMITSQGLEGGPIYSHSGAIRDALDRDGRCVDRCRSSARPDHRSADRSARQASGEGFDRDVSPSNDRSEAGVCFAAARVDGQPHPQRSSGSCCGREVCIARRRGNHAHRPSDIECRRHQPRGDRRIIHAATPAGHIRRRGDARLGGADRRVPAAGLLQHG